MITFTLCFFQLASSLIIILLNLLLALHFSDIIHPRSRSQVLLGSVHYLSAYVFTFVPLQIDPVQPLSVNSGDIVNSDQQDMVVPDEADTRPAPGPADEVIQAALHERYWVFYVTHCKINILFNFVRKKCCNDYEKYYFKKVIMVF